MDGSCGLNSPSFIMIHENLSLKNIYISEVITYNFIPFHCNSPIRLLLNCLKNLNYKKDVPYMAHPKIIHNSF